jgi:hypothetical protein
MLLEKTFVALPAAALLLAGTVGLSAAQSISPLQAAQLNAGTAHTGLGPRGLVGVGISAVQLEVMELGHVEVAGVMIGYANDGGSPTISTLGEPHLAAMLNAGTAYTGLGADGHVRNGIQGAVPSAAVTAQAGMDGYAAY